MVDSYTTMKSLQLLNSIYIYIFYTFFVVCFFVGIFMDVINIQWQVCNNRLKLIFCCYGKNTVVNWTFIRQKKIWSTNSALSWWSSGTVGSFTFFCSFAESCTTFYEWKNIFILMPLQLYVPTGLCYTFIILYYGHLLQRYKWQQCLKR